jgi:hypothetical protein
VTDKVNVSFNGGGEYRQYQDTPSRVFPIFDFNASYTPFDGTRLTFSGYREQVVSYAEIGSDYLSTLVQADLKQRFLTDCFFLASAGYNLADYEAASGQTIGSQRRDDYYFLNAGVEWDPREWMSLSLRYQYSTDDSNFAANSFNDNQVDVQTSVEF